jgi:hypothetical protein
MNTKTTRTISLIALAIFASNTVALPAMCADTDHASKVVAKAAQTGADTGAKPGQPKTITLSLTKLRDTGLAIRLVRQQALNILLEATRTEIKPTDKCAIAEPVGDNVNVTKDSCGAYLPPRKEWLVVYLTAIEPVSQLLRKWQGNVSAGTVIRKVPKGKQLDKLNEIFESEKPDNVELAAVSKGLLQSAKNLEKLREQEFNILKEAANKGVSDTEVL